MLVIDSLSVWYGPTEVLRNVSFTVERGSIVALLGGNGAGKTTLLKTLSGLLRPTRGSVMFEGRTLSGLDPRDIVIAGISQVPQGRFVWPSMTVRDNLELGAITRNDRAGIEADIERVCAIYPRLKEKMTRAAGSMSGGEQQMLAIGRALMARPKLLLMDEPSHGLSPLMVQDLITAVANINREGMSILLIEQNVGVAAALAGATHVLANGEIAMTTTGERVATDPAVLRNYLGR
jgi:branched-chain amino acid transport system ATP-binding protein